MRRILILLLILIVSLTSVAQVATIKLADGTKIVNAPTDRSWEGYVVKQGGFAIFDNPPDVWSIDDSDTSKLKYVGDWTFNSSGCDCSWSRATGAYVTFHFTNADKVEWYGENMSHHGIAQVFLDSNLEATVDTYSPTNKDYTLNWVSDSLDPEKVYELKIAVAGQKNPASTGTPIVIREFKVYTAAPRPDPENPVVVDDIIITVSDYERRDDGNHPYPRHLMDGNPASSSRWSVEGLNQWAVFELPELKLIHSVDIAWAFSRTNIFDLKLSGDGQEWATIFDKAQSTLVAEQLQTFDFPDTTAKFVAMVVQGYGDIDRQWNSVSEFAISYSEIVEPPPVDPPTSIPPTEFRVNIVRDGYFIVLVDGVQLGGGHSEYDKAVEKAVNAILEKPSSNVLIQAPKWRVERNE